jgi:hypothetical protein
VTGRPWWPRARGWLFGLVLPVLMWAPIVVAFQPDTTTEDRSGKVGSFQDRPPCPDPHRGLVVLIDSTARMFEDGSACDDTVKV